MPLTGTGPGSTLLLKSVMKCSRPPPRDASGTLNMILSLAQHAASMITKSKKGEDSREVQGAFLESLRFLPAASSPPTTSPKTLRKRLEEEFANNSTTRSKFFPGSATLCRSMIDHASLLSWLTLNDARTSVSQQCQHPSPPRHKQSLMQDAIQAEHQVKDNERLARDKL